ncbi:Possible enoyl-CoA hydratase/isomerase [Mycobacteroides abscessus subsp. massiliense]|nr:Possible enoyl-CoA hydratase/isomerase [Mycobacteroides abscessus subsp. massiliense]
MPSGRRLGGSESLNYQIVDAAVAEDQVLSTATSFVAPLVGKNRDTLGTVKYGMYGSIVPLLLAGLGS